MDRRFIPSAFTRQILSMGSFPWYICEIIPAKVENSLSRVSGLELLCCIVSSGAVQSAVAAVSHQCSHPAYCQHKCRSHTLNQSWFFSALAEHQVLKTLWLRTQEQQEQQKLLHSADAQNYWVGFIREGTGLVDLFLLTRFHSCFATNESIFRDIFTSFWSYKACCSHLWFYNLALYSFKALGN